MQRIFHAAIGLLIASVLACPGRAAVVEATANGFAIEQTVHIAAPPAKVYDALVHPAEWWDSGHTFSGSAANLSIEPHAGGCFCEALADGGSVQHAQVVVAAPGETLRLRGPLGPFQDQGVDGALTFALKAEAGGTELTLSNNIGGFMKGGFGDWPGRADAMLAQQMAHLKQYLETGSPGLKPAEDLP
ncbi:MAG: SRPBCC domain-containing protein [Rhizomicrobium sp.]